MKDRRIFDAFVNANEKTIEELSKIPVLSDEDKDRIFKNAMSKADEKGVSEHKANIIMMETLNKQDSAAPEAAVKKNRNRAFMNVAAACIVVAVGTAVVLNGLGRDSALKKDKPYGYDASSVDKSDSKGGSSGADRSGGKESAAAYYHPYDSSSSVRRYNVSGFTPQNEEYIDYEITDEEQLERIDAVLDEIDRIKDDCIVGENGSSGEEQGVLLSTSDDIKYFISMVGDQPQLTINFIDYDIPQELIDQLMAVITPTATGQYAEALRLTQALDTIDRLAGGSDAVYEATEASASVGEGYAKLTDFGFASVSDIDSFMRDNMTDDFINAFYGNVVGTERPIYTESDGAMYIDTFACRESGYTWTETEFIISDVKADSFSATAEYATAEGTAQLKLYIVNDGGQWKISGLDFL